jgi:hypothetical protein
MFTWKRNVALHLAQTGLPQSVYEHIDLGFPLETPAVSVLARSWPGCLSLGNGRCWGSDLGLGREALTLTLKTTCPGSRK